MGVIDATIVNVALPSIKHDLGFSQSGLAWVLNAYLISAGLVAAAVVVAVTVLRPRRERAAGAGLATPSGAACAEAA